MEQFSDLRERPQSPIEANRPVILNVLLISDF